LNNEVDISELNKYIEGYDNFAENYMQNEKNDMSISVYDLNNLYKTTAKLNGNKMAEAILNYNLYMNYEINTGDTVENTSVTMALDHGEHNGPEVVIPGGYINVFNPLYKQTNIQLETEVKSVLRRKKCRNEKVILETNKGSIEADYAVLTVPLGVLKSNKIKFDPQLSREKREVINNLGIASLDKVILEFSENFWDDNYDALSVISLKISPLTWAVNLHKIAGKNALMFLIGGYTKYYDLYKTSKENVENDFLKVLRQLYPEKKVEITRSIITNWTTDEFALGSYSAIPPGTNLEMLLEFRKSEGNLFFAGEHTIIERPGTVDSAWLSGLLVAKEILDEINHVDDRFLTN